MRGPLKGGPKNPYGLWSVALEQKPAIYIACACMMLHDSTAVVHMGPFSDLRMPDTIL